MRVHKPFDGKMGTEKIVEQQYAAYYNHNTAVEDGNKTVGAKKMQTTDVGAQVQRKRNQKLVKNQEKQQMNLHFFISDNESNRQAEYSINKSEYQL